jgi:sialidase-1
MNTLAAAKQLGDSASAPGLISHITSANECRASGWKSLRRPGSRVGLLILFVLAQSIAAAAESPKIFEKPLFVAGQGGYFSYRIPAIVRTTNGTLLAFCEGRKTSASDSGDIDIVMRRSTDNGQSWSAVTLVQEEGATAKITIGNPAPVVDEITGQIHLLFCRNNERVFHTVSKDDGMVWSLRDEVTAAVKLDTWRWYATGPLHGIQLKRDSQAGRLVVPSDHRLTSGAYGAHAVYSDDHGATWHLGAVADSANGVNPNETACVEIARPGSTGGSIIYFNSRDNQGPAPGTRAEAWSMDGGSTFVGAFTNQLSFVCPVVQGSLLGLRSRQAGNSRLLFCCPNNTAARTDLSIWCSSDEAKSWLRPKLVYNGPSAYSDMVQTTESQVALLYERGVSKPYETITFARFDGAWLDEFPPHSVRSPALRRLGTAP